MSTIIDELKGSPSNVQRDMLTRLEFESLLEIVMTWHYPNTIRTRKDACILVTNSVASNYDEYKNYLGAQEQVQLYMETYVLTKDDLDIYSQRVIDDSKDNDVSVPYNDTQYKIGSSTAVAMALIEHRSENITSISWDKETEKLIIEYYSD